jgi:hypothetical protein
MKNILIPLLTSLIICIGCSTEPNKSPELFKVKVDSISHTPFGAMSDTLVVKVYGTIGNDGCCSFSRFEDIKQPLQLDLTVWGQRSSSVACPAVMVYLDGRDYKWIATQQGWFTINIHQPDNTLLKDSIVIK